MDLKRGVTIVGKFVKLTLSTDGSELTIETNNKAPGNVTPEQVAAELDTILEWNRDNDHSIRLITFQLWHTSLHLLCTYIGAWLATAVTSKMIGIMVEASHLCTEHVWRSADPKVLWEDDEFLLLRREDGDTLLVDLQEEGGPISRNSLLELIFTAPLERILGRVVSIAEKEGFTKVIIITHSNLPHMQHAALEAAVQRCPWPTTVEQVGHTTFEDGSQPNWLKMEPDEAQDAAS